MDLAYKVIDLVREAQLEEVYQYLKVSFMKTKRAKILESIASNQDSDKSLTADEKAYLRKIISSHFEFYRTIAESSHCTNGNQKIYQLVKGLWEKLQ